MINLTTREGDQGGQELFPPQSGPFSFVRSILQPCHTAFIQNRGRQGEVEYALWKIPHITSGALLLEENLVIMPHVNAWEDRECSLSCALAIILKSIVEGKRCSGEMLAGSA